MIFASPWMLLLLLIPIGGLLLPFPWRRGVEGRIAMPAMWRAFAAGGRVRLGDATPRRPWRFWVAFLLLVLALARPQWGARPDEDNIGGEVVLALDLSRSMLATDALPSRIERARTVAMRFVAESPTTDIGLIAFAGRAYTLARPSADRALLLTFLPAVQPDQMVVPGSDLAGVLNVALDAFHPKASARTLVLLSDGEAEPAPWRHLLPRLQARGIHIVTVGFGTAEGAHINIDGRDLVSSGGAIVTSRLQADILRDIAHSTGGIYVDAADAKNLAARVRAIDRGAAGKRAEPAAEAMEDRFAWFLLPALLLLIWSALVEWPALPRLPNASRRWSRPAAHASVAILALLLASPRGEAVEPSSMTLRKDAPEPDPLLGVKRVVGRNLAKSRLTAADHMALAQVTLRYGEDHRQHAHLLQMGVVQDGLAAVDAGQALEPHRPGWAELRAKLLRLLMPARTADDAEEGDGLPDGGQPGPQEEPDDDEAGYDPNGPPPDTRSIGGAPRSQAERSEWYVPSLVKPAYTLRKLRDADRPGELFRLLQLQDPVPAGQKGQTW